MSDEVEIQCPDCGTIIKFNEFEPFHCDKCKRYFDEDEIREACGMIEKTHQAPRCKVCNRPFPRLDQGTMVCKSCKDNKGKTLEKWL